MIIPASAISVNSTAKTLTLTAPYIYTVEKILSIWNLTKGFEIYNYRDPNKRQLFSGSAGIDISVSGAVITFIEDAACENDDVIRIEVDDVANSSEGSATAITIYTDEALTVSGTGNAVKSTIDTPTNVSSYSVFNVEMKNAGASTNCTVKVMGKFAADDTLYTTLAVRTLGANGTDAAFSDAVIGDLPTHIYFDIKNNDATNEASITIKCQAR
jgi:hypothetical protein